MILHYTILYHIVSYYRARGSGTVRAARSRGSPAHLARPGPQGAARGGRKVTRPVTNRLRETRWRGSRGLLLPVGSRALRSGRSAEPHDNHSHNHNNENRHSDDTNHTNNDNDNNNNNHSHNHNHHNHHHHHPHNNNNNNSNNNNNNND